MKKINTTGKKNKMTKVYDPDSDDELNGDLGMAKHDDNIENDNEEHISRAKGQTIKNTNKNKPSSKTLKEESLKVTNTKKTNEEDKDETIYSSYDKD